jgi:hypothetical protein
MLANLKRLIDKQTKINTADLLDTMISPSYLQTLFKKDVEQKTDL